jgi:hypothetical protein
MINFAKPIYFQEQWIAFQYFFPRCVNLKLKFYDFHQNLGIVNLNHFNYECEEFSASAINILFCSSCHLMVICWSQVLCSVISAPFVIICFLYDHVVARTPRRQIMNIIHASST